MACAICELRRPKRYCPGIQAEICSICCGTEREVTVNCPFDCEFLREARHHDKPVELDPKNLPNRDIEVPEKFLRQNEGLLAFVGQGVLRAALATPGASDPDVREALEALIRTYRTLESGVYYDTVPQGMPAANIYAGVQQQLAEFRQEEQQRYGTPRTRDAEVLAILVFLQRLELTQANGRPRGRAFLGALHDFYSAGPEAEAPASSSLILP